MAISKARKNALSNLEKEWKKAKAKTYRAKKRGVVLDFPFDENLREIKKGHTQTLKSQYKQLKNFNSRTNLKTNLIKINKDVWITADLKKQLSDVESELRIIKRREDDRQKKLPVKADGVIVSTVYEQNRMKNPDTSFSRFIPEYNLKTARRMADVQKAVKTRQNRASEGWYDKKAKTMKENFIYSLEERFNSLADDILIEIENMTPYEFVNFYEGYVEIDFKFIPSDQPAITDDDYAILDDIRETLRDLKENDLFIT